MNARNAYLNEVLVMSDHALERWRLRGDSDDLVSALESAVPFGAQRGEDNLLLISGDSVFATVQKGNLRVVTTVLTKNLALANIEAGGSRSIAAQLVGTPIMRKSLSADELEQIAAETRRLSQSGARLVSMSDEELEAFRAVVRNFWEECKVLRSLAPEVKKVTAKLGPLVSEADKEVGRRRKAKKSVEKIEDCELWRQSVKKAMRESLPEGQYLAILSRADQIRREERGV